MAKKKNFEDSLNRLEQIADEMEKGDISLNEAFKLYKEGFKEATFCSEFLKNIEKEVKILQENIDDTFKLAKFESLEE